MALMRALMVDLPALLLDEPLGALDPSVPYDLQENSGAFFRRTGQDRGSGHPRLRRGRFPGFTTGFAA